MNTLRGKIEEINTKGQLSLVRISVNTEKITAIVIDTPETASYLQIGGDINVLFKATEVVIGTGSSLSISLQNQFRGTIHTIKKGALLSKIVVETSVGMIDSIITTNAVNKLKLAIGVEVTAMIKTNEIMLAK